MEALSDPGDLDLQDFKLSEVRVRACADATSSKTSHANFAQCLSFMSYCKTAFDHCDWGLPNS